MKDLFAPEVICTDPDTLQFCRKISETTYWYCEPDTCHPKLFCNANTPENCILERYKGFPGELRTAATQKEDVKKFITTQDFWLSGEIDVTEIEEEEIAEISASYGYSPEYLKANPMILCECYFESYPGDFRCDY